MCLKWVSNFSPISLILIQVLDADWAGSDRPVLSCADSCIRIMDLKLHQGCSSVEEHQVTGTVHKTFTLRIEMT